MLAYSGMRPCASVVWNVTLCWRRLGCDAVLVFPDVSKEHTVFIFKGSADPSTYPSTDTVLYITALERHSPNLFFWQKYELQYRAEQRYHSLPPQTYNRRHYTIYNNIQYVVNLLNVSASFGHLQGGIQLRKIH